MGSKKANISRSRVKHHGKRNFLILSIVTVLLIIIVVAVSTSRPPATATVGAPAPDFTIQDISNNNFHLYDHRGKPILLEFMTTRCTYCTQQAPILSNLWSQHKDHAVFLSVSVDPAYDQPNILSAYAQTHNMPWSWARDTISPDSEKPTE